MAELWTKEQTDELASLWASGLSASQIGARLGMTRNAVLGRVHRLKLGKRRDAYAPKKQRVPGLRRAPAKKRPGLVVVRPSIFDFVGPFQPLDWCVNPVGMVDLGRDHCRWPAGEPNQMQFCGESKLDGYVYCARHCRMAYRPNRRAA